MSVEEVEAVGDAITKKLAPFLAIMPTPRFAAMIRETARLSIAALDAVRAKRGVPPVDRIKVDQSKKRDTEAKTGDGASGEVLTIAMCCPDDD